MTVVILDPKNARKILFKNPKNAREFYY